MDIRKLQRAIVDGLEDVKAHNIVVFNTEHLSPLFERVIIATGTSNRQTKALASSVREAVKGKGLAAPRTEGEENGEWIIVDCGAAVVHLMQPAIRAYYHLEELWGGKSVKMKLDNQPVHLVKASAPAPRARAAASARSEPARAGATQRVAGKARVVAARYGPATQAPLRKGAAKKRATKRAPATEAGAARPPARAKAGATSRSAPQRAAGAKRAATAKTVVRKVAAKKSAPRA